MYVCDFPNSFTEYFAGSVGTALDIKARIPNLEIAGSNTIAATCYLFMFFFQRVLKKTQQQLNRVVYLLTPPPR